MRIKSLIACVCISLVILINFSLADEVKANKKVVSIVYDDSGSMLTNNNFCYSSYALQILTASLSKNDELNIVRMSEYWKDNEIDLSVATKKQECINGMQNYQTNGGTPFESVDTAKNWLIKKSNQYTDEAEYWLIVITDGIFSNMPNTAEYMANLNSSFNNLNFEFVLLSIGGYLDNPLVEEVKVSANSTVIEANDRESIYESLMDICRMINSGATDKIVSLEKKDEKTIKLKSNYPLKKMMILLQNDDNYVNEIIYENNKLNKETFKVENSTESLKGNLTHVVSSSEGYLNSGEYTIKFNKPIQLNKNLMFLCEAFVEAKISIVDANGRELTNAQMNFLTKNNVVKVKCEIFNAVDGTKPEEIYPELNVQLINNKNQYNMVYDSSTKAFYTEITLIDVNNNIYSMVEAKDLFRVKSNVILIDTDMGQANIERYKNNLMEIEVPYSSSKEYKKLSKFNFSFINEDELHGLAQKFELELIDLPKGIKVSYQGKEYKNGDKIPMIREFGKEYILDILVNKDYTDTQETIITLKILSGENGGVVYWTSTGFDEEYIKLKPKAYPIKLINKNNDLDIDVQNEKLILEAVRTADESENSSIIGKISLSDIKKINTKNNFTSGYTFKVSKNDKVGTLDIKITPNIFALLGKDTTKIDIEIILNNEIESGKYLENIKLSNISAWLILRPYIFGLIIIIIGLGYVTKKKFNKKSQITITEGTDSTVYALRPELKTVLLPYVSHKTKIGVIEFIAGKGSDIMFSAINLTVKQINGENFEEYIQNNNVNLDKVVMKKDLSVVTVEAFDVIQKYEYLTKEVEISDYADEDFSSEYIDEEF